MQITDELIDHIAKLARLKISAEKRSQFATDLTNVMTLVEQLKEVDTENVSETSQVTGLTNVTREDEVLLCDREAALLACSPQTIESKQIKMPKIM